MRVASTLVLALVATGVLTTEVAECNKNQDCATGHCVKNICRACRRDKHCPDHQDGNKTYCIKNVCGSNRAEGDVCTHGAHCQTDHCVNNICRVCKWDRHCPKDQDGKKTYCIKNVCGSNRAEGDVCTHKAHCRGFINPRCHKDVCRQCLSGFDCYRNQDCYGFTCHCGLEINGFDVQGDQVRSKKFPNGLKNVASTDECCAACRSDPTCTAWVYVTDGTRKCFPLKKWDFGVHWAKSRAFGVVGARQKFSMRKGIDVGAKHVRSVNYLNGLKNVSTDECNDACLSDPLCEGWVYVTDGTRECFPLQSFTDVHRSKNRAVGVVWWAQSTAKSRLSPVKRPSGSSGSGSITSGSTHGHGTSGKKGASGKKGRRLR